MLVLWLMGLGVLGFWCLQAGNVSTAHGWGFAALVFSAGVALAGWVGTGPGALDWDGNGWSWTPDGELARVGPLSVAIDLQALLLLRFDAVPGRVYWLWVGQADDPAHWRAFRRAVFCGPRTGASGEPAFTGLGAAGPASR